jgi:hypothetical protein
MPNVPLAYVSVYRRMSDIFHTLAYASRIRNSVTGPLCMSRDETYVSFHYLIELVNGFTQVELTATRIEW